MLPPPIEAPPPIKPVTEPVPDPAVVLEQAAAFYQQQLHRYPEARHYLAQRRLHDPGTIQELRIGYAPGGAKADPKGKAKNKAKGQARARPTGWPPRGFGSRSFTIARAAARPGRV